MSHFENEKRIRNGAQKVDNSEQKNGAFFDDLPPIPGWEGDTEVGASNHNDQKNAPEKSIDEPPKPRRRGGVQSLKDLRSSRSQAAEDEPIAAVADDPAVRQRLMSAQAAIIPDAEEVETPTVTIDMPRPRRQAATAKPPESESARATEPKPEKAYGRPVGKGSRGEYKKKPRPPKQPVKLGRPPKEPGAPKHPYNMDMRPHHVDAIEQDIAAMADEFEGIDPMVASVVPGMSEPEPAPKPVAPPKVEEEVVDASYDPRYPQSLTLQMDEPLVLPPLSVEKVKLKRAKPKPRSISDLDAIKRIDKILRSLSGAEKRRVMDFIGEKYFAVGRVRPEEL